MESQGVVGAIQVTQQVYAALAHHADYHFTLRGTLEIKGKGEMPVYLLTGVSN
jgi:class 3 adenylate cyclase